MNKENLSNMNIENKKGQMLPEEVLKMVLSIMSILILVGLLTAYFYTSASADSLRQAESKLNGDNGLKAVINGLDSGKNTVFPIDQPLGWHFYTFSIANLGTPNQCVGKPCVCICKDTWTFRKKDKRDEVIEECSEDGSCLIIDNLYPVPREGTEESNDGFEISTKNPLSINVTKDEEDGRPYIEILKEEE